MAFSYAFQGLAGLSPALSIESLAPGLGPGKFWDGGKGQWVASAGATVAAKASAAYPDKYEVLIPDAQARTWPDGSYRVTRLNLANQPGFQVNGDPEVVTVVGGSNTDLPYAEISVQGGVLRIYGAVFLRPAGTNPVASIPVAPTSPPAAPSDPDATPVANAAAGKPATS